MPIVGGRAPNPSYYRGISGSKDQFPAYGKPSSQTPSAAPAPHWGGPSEPASKPAPVSLTRAEREKVYKGLSMTHKEAVSILNVSARSPGAKGGAGEVLSAASLKTISRCVAIVKKGGADPSDAKLALQKMIAKQDPTSSGVETLKQLLKSLG